MAEKMNAIYGRYLELKPDDRKNIDRQAHLLEIALKEKAIQKNTKIQFGFIQALELLFVIGNCLAKEDK